jgi:hypothetical protein
MRAFSFTANRECLWNELVHRASVILGTSLAGIVANSAMMVCLAGEGLIRTARSRARQNRRWNGNPSLCLRLFVPVVIPVFVPVTKAMKQRTWSRIASACSSLALMPLAGCVARGAPSFVLFGAYFPFWLLSSVMGVVGALVAHRAFVATGWARGVPYQLSVCTAIGIVVGVFFWLLGTGQL